MFTGGGTAGCVLANRLSTNPDLRVLVVERGPVGDNWLARVPLFSSAHRGNPLVERTKSVYQSAIGGVREIFVGNGLGGTSVSGG